VFSTIENLGQNKKHFHSKYFLSKQTKPKTAPFSICFSNSICV